MVATTDICCDDIDTVLADFEAQLLKPPAVPATILDPLSGPSTYPRTAGVSLQITAPESVNTNSLRNQDVQEVDDTILVELRIPITPKAQKTSRAEGYAVSTRALQRLTVEDFRARWHVRHQSTRRTLRTGEYLMVQHRFRVRRYQALGDQ